MNWLSVGGELVTGLRLVLIPMMGIIAILITSWPFVEQKLAYLGVRWRENV